MAASPVLLSDKSMFKVESTNVGYSFMLPFEVWSSMPKLAQLVDIIPVAVTFKVAPAPQDEFDT